MAYDCSEEEARLQQKLIPLNIVVCILCLVAIISLLVAPLFKVDLSKINETIVEVLVQEDGSSGSDDSGSTEGGSQFNYEAMLEGLEGEFSCTTIELGKFAFSEDNSLVMFIDRFLTKSGVLEKMLVPIVSEAMLSQLNVDTTDLDLTTLNDKFKAIGDAKSEEEFRGAVGEWIDELARLADTTIDPEDKATVEDNFAELYNQTIEATGGEFDLEKLICVVASRGAELDEPITDYTSFIMYMMSEGGEGTDMAVEIDDVIKTLAKSMFGMVAFACAVWFILFLFSLLHIFAQNKRFMMWYVKMFGFYPCLLFGVVPTVLAGAFTTAGGAMAVVGSILGFITSFTWISGVCYLLLWLISIFWAFPIKRKIRADRRG